MDCNKCGVEFVTVTSSREMEVSQIYCSDCGDFNSYEVPEEDAIDLYKNYKQD